MLDADQLLIEHAVIEPSGGHFVQSSTTGKVHQCGVLDHNLNFDTDSIKVIAERVLP